MSMNKASFRKFTRFALWAPRIFHAAAPDNRGVVLLAVLWICALIMWFGFQISAQTRIQGEDQLHAIRRSQALYLATGGCYEALARMKPPNPLPGQGQGQQPDLDWEPDGRPRTVEYKTGVAVVIMESEELKVNVNIAQEEELKKALVKAGANQAASERLAARIADFIDPDDDPRPQGMEKNEYTRAGLNYIPFNAPLTSLDQLLLIPGMSHQLFYGIDSGTDQKRGKLPEIFDGLLVPGKNSLFSLLTIYGNNASMPQEMNQQQGQTAPNPLTWKSGGLYRILSFGKTFNGLPSVGIWLEVRLVGENGDQQPYKILSRKVL